MDIKLYVNQDTSQTQAHLFCIRNVISVIKLVIMINAVDNQHVRLLILLDVANEKGTVQGHDSNT